jgi:hypothetical protein
MDFSKYINKDKNEVDKFTLVKSAFEEPALKYIVVGVGAILLLYAAGKVMSVVSNTVVEYKHLRTVLRT